MRLFNKVAIIGTGLIGGSIALAIKKKRLCNEIVGVSRHKKTLLLAKKCHAIDKGSQDINIIQGADLVILATPVNTILDMASRINKIVGRACIVTDVGSTKEVITRKLTRIFSRFVGSHPLAGSEKRGIINACPDIFKDSVCVLTPLKNTDAQALAKVKKLWTELGARVVFLNPHIHDKILSFVSHLPHLVAFSLIAAVPKNYLKFASTGLKDTTRIAGSESELWNDIFLSNRRNILRSIDIFQENLSKLKMSISKKDTKQLNKILKYAKIKRDGL